MDRAACGTRRCGLGFAMLLSAGGLFGCAPPPAVGADDAGVAPPADLSLSRDLARTRTPAASVQGRLVDEGGYPLGRFKISACSVDGCRSTDTAADGAFTLGGMRLIEAAIRSHEDFEDAPRLGAAIRLVSPRTDLEVIDIGTMYAPRLGSGADFTPGAAGPETLAVGDGLELAVVPKELELPLGLEEIRNVAARRIAAEHHQAFDLPGERVLAVYAIFPYGTQSTAPVGVRAKIAATPGRAIQFRAVDILEGRMQPPVPGHAADDGQSVATDPGAGLRTFTWLIISE